MTTKDLQIRQLFPNAITMTALGFGVSSLNMAFWGHWQMAVLFIMLSGLFDFLDGGVARLLRVESRFGAQLDSLSDFVSFGVAPGFLMYQWTMDQEARIGVLQNTGYLRSEAVGIYWGFALFLAMCSAMRLARFNSMLDSDTPQPPYWKHFFMGVPAPAGAGLAILPLIFWLATNGQFDFLRSPVFVGPFLVFSGIMMASRIPTICLKHLHIPEHLMLPLRIVLLFMMASLLTFPWITLSVIGLGYLVTIPFGIRYFLGQKHVYESKKKGVNMVKHYFAITVILLTSGIAMAQLAANPWENKSPVVDKTTYTSKPSLPDNTVIEDWRVPELGYAGEKTVWTTARGQREIAPDANITNVLLMSQHLRNLGYQIPDGIDNLISTAPARLRAEILASMQQLQNSSNPVATASVGFAEIFEQRTGLSINNLIQNSLRIIDARR